VSHERGDVVWAADPFREGGSGRPWLVVGGSATPFHGDQFICVAITSKGYHEEAVSLHDAGLPRESYAMPWSVSTIEAGDITRAVGTVSEELVAGTVEPLLEYVVESPSQ
jgi:mRNA-degrading endonuclease toxin of MazEF toxin-antitoxin module